jgi:hypothetical protein
MRIPTAALAVFALALVSQNASARELSIASATPQGVACAFAPSCGITPVDSTGFFQMFGQSGYGRLLTRTYPGLPGTQAAGLTGYSYFITMRGARSLGYPNCVKKLVLDAGPVVPLKFAPNRVSDMFMVAAPDGAAVAAAEQDGSKITIRFARQICPGDKGVVESLYFGFAARTGPMPAKAQITGSVRPGATDDMATTAVRVPQH